MLIVAWIAGELFLLVGLVFLAEVAAGRTDVFRLDTPNVRFRHYASWGASCLLGVILLVYVWSEVGSAALKSIIVALGAITIIGGIANIFVSKMHAKSSV